MVNIFFKKIEIKKYKRLEDKSFELNCPDGSTEGSGLNILIGENGTGKTSILEAINFLTQSKYSSENKLSINDFFNYKNPIEIIGHTDEFKCNSSIDYYKHLHFISNGICFKANSRDRKENNKILSSQFAVKNGFCKSSENYYKGNEEQKGKKYKIDGRDLIFSNSYIDEGGIDVIYFDKNRSRHLVSGTYKTIFDKICDDLNWRFIKNLPKNTDSMKENITGEYFANTLDISQKGIGKNLAEKMVEFFDNDMFNDLKIDLIDILQPFSNASLVIRNEDLKQINARNLGSGFEIIMTLFLLKSLSAGSKNNSMVYLIDEPELHLHPKAQESLAKLLLEESKDKQIIISTHSPYMFKKLVPHAGLITLTVKDKELSIKKKDGNSEKLLPWSPSWGEINFEAYDMPTIEFHNELYGYLCENLGNGKIKDFEEFLDNQGIKKNKNWKRKKSSGQEVEENMTLHTYIRHSIHHSENKQEESYSNEELSHSIKDMIELVKKYKRKTMMASS